MASSSFILADALLPPNSLSVNTFHRPPTVFVVSFVGRGDGIFGRQRSPVTNTGEMKQAVRLPAFIPSRWVLDAKETLTSRQKFIHILIHHFIRPVIQAGTHFQTTIPADVSSADIIHAGSFASLPPPLRWNQVRVIFSSHYLPFRSSYSLPLSSKQLIFSDVIHNSEQAVCVNPVSHLLPTRGTRRHQEEPQKFCSSAKSIAKLKIVLR